MSVIVLDSKCRQHSQMHNHQSMNLPLILIIHVRVQRILLVVVAMDGSLTLPKREENRQSIQTAESLKFPILLLPNMAEFNAAQTVSRLDGHNCHPSGLDHGFEYANKLNAS